MNRAIEDVTLFETATQYEAFLALLACATDRFAVDLYAFCLMPNHWHLVVRPRRARELPAYMRWLTRVHAQRWRLASDTVGRGAVYQGRYRFVPIEDDGHFATVCRYVERNALRAGLVSVAEHWPWSSAFGDDGNSCTRPTLAPWPVPRSAAWSEILNEPDIPSVLERVRGAIRAGVPFGEAHWEAQSAAELSLTRRFRGRPRRSEGPVSAN
jgi:putative transposase